MRNSTHIKMISTARNKLRMIVSVLSEAKIGKKEDKI